MELCNQLRALFINHPGHRIDLVRLQQIINEKLEKEYTLDQIVIGLDYAGFSRSEDGYQVRVNMDFEGSD